MIDWVSCDVKLNGVWFVGDECEMKRVIWIGFGMGEGMGERVRMRVIYGGDR